MCAISYNELQAFIIEDTNNRIYCYIYHLISGVPKEKPTCY